MVNAKKMTLLASVAASLFLLSNVALSEDTASAEKKDEAVTPQSEKMMCSCMKMKHNMQKKEGEGERGIIGFFKKGPKGLIEDPY